MDTRRLIRVFSAFLLILALAVPASAQAGTNADDVTKGPDIADTEPSAPNGAGSARDITGSAEFSAWGTYDYSVLYDGAVSTYIDIGYGDAVTVTCEEPIAGVYLKFFLQSAAWTVGANGSTLDCGQNGFIHEYADLSESTGEAKEIVLTFPRGASVAEITLYSAGELPDDVQRWEAPLDGSADLLMFSSHADDEQLFFAGVLPDAVAKGAACEVVYFCDHSEEPGRVHEQLNGLWVLGVKYYPVFGKFPDVYSESREEGEAAFAAQGFGEEDFLEWQVENIRRFKPQVLVIHDEAGEYGHGTHIINSATAREAVTLAADTEEFPYTLVEYGAWDTPKVYMHLYGENGIVLDFDKPLEYFGGKTAYEMACLGFAEHRSQHWTWFYEWMYGVDSDDPTGERFTSAAQIATYSPCRWGLWRSLVGSDENADMFDHIMLYFREDADARETESETESETVVDTAAAAPVTDAAGGEGDNAFRDRMTMVIIAIAAVVLLAVVIALIASSVRGRREERERQKEEERRTQRSKEQMRRVKEARDERARREASMQEEALRQRAAERSKMRALSQDGHAEQNAAEEDPVATPRTDRGEAGAVPTQGAGPSASKNDAGNSGGATPPSAASRSRADAIRAARAARGRGEGAHDKPTDKRY